MLLSKFHSKIKENAFISECVSRCIRHLWIGTGDTRWRAAGCWRSQWCPKRQIQSKVMLMAAEDTQEIQPQHHQNSCICQHSNLIGHLRKLKVIVNRKSWRHKECFFCFVFFKSWNLLKVINPVKLSSHCRWKIKTELSTRFPLHNKHINKQISKPHETKVAIFIKLCTRLLR